MATKTRKPAAKKPAAKKATAPKVKIQTTGKGRTTPALTNRHRWSATELEALATKVAKAGTSKAKRDAVYVATAKKIGNGISAASVRAQYYAHMRKSGQPVGNPRGTSAPRVPKAGNVPVLGAAPSLPTDPVQKVKAMVQRRGQVTRAVESSMARQAAIASQIEALTAEQSKHAAVIEQGQAELTDLNTKLGVFA